MDYKGNSKGNKKPETKEVPEKNLDKVVTGDVIVTKPTIGHRFKNIFFGGDFDTAGRYVVAEVLLPALRNLLVESVSKGADRLIYGDNAPRRARTNYSPRTQYSNPMYRDDPRSRALLPNQAPSERWVASSTKAFEDVIVGTKEDADTVVERMTDIVDQYEVVSIADLHELLGLASAHTDNKWGWSHLSTIEVRQVREGWRITFPPVEAIS